VVESAEVADLLSTQEAADILGVTSSRVRQLCAEGALPCQKLGRDWFVKRSDVVKFSRLPPGVVGKPRRLTKK
jgi:excisionase family DNA binding protein